MPKLTTTRTSPDAICAAYASKQSKLTVSASPADENTIVIEGDRKALEFLGKLLLAQAATEDCGFHLGPRKAGNALFTEKSTKGLYIHRLPCEHSRTRRK